MYFPFFLSPPQIMHYLGILEYFIWLNLEILKRPKWHNQCPTGKLRNKKKKRLPLVIKMWNLEQLETWLEQEKTEV